MRLGILMQWLRRGAFLTLLWMLWLIVVAAGGWAIYWKVYDFDAADWLNWIEIRQRYLHGAVIPFNFVATALGLACLAFSGGVLLTVRFDRLHGFLLGLWPDIGWMLPVPSRFRLRPQGKARFRSTGARAAPASRELSIRILLPLVLTLARWGRALARTRTRTQTPAAAAMTEPSQGADEGACAVIQTPAAEVAADAPPDVSPTVEPPASISLPTDGEAAVSTDKEGRSDGDLVVFERIMALFEVWADPAPDWMRDALREEFDSLSEAGWSLFSDFGEPALASLDAVAAAGVLPQDPTCRAALDARLDEYRVLSLATAASSDDTDGEPGAESEVRPSPGGARLSMSAAWLGEMVDNFVMLEEIRAAGDAGGSPSFEDRWGAIYRETGERLKIAMRAMTDEDWRSIDQFPDRAGRIRIQTDRLREELRALPAPEGEGCSVAKAAPPPSDEGEPLAAGVAAESDPPHEDDVAGEDHARPVDWDGGGPPVEEILRAAGYVVRRLPLANGGASGDKGDYLAQRDGFSLLLRVAELAGDDWRLDDGSLAPWQGRSGQAVPSPCRALWQRLALLRSSGREGRPSAGLLILRGGRFADEAAAAAVIDRDRRRTGVDVAWLDQPSSSLPDLPGWLRQMETVRAESLHTG
ncbi:hypothetical protein [Telmatospirillum siberiense]|uniref:Uncharacterized protein n=1 Tax=Telmatospirillum siberiense TaxID=382514 RepID=A0A2N3Q0U4_9PROT|nr:hypothetical protein [Telmatospirillum siberiense]PKU26288.1 hypothetical protein CWS72_00055 [Telmatospirillum siberiense]